MIQTTLGQAKIALAPFCGATGMAITDPRVIGYINRGQEELMNAGDWPNVVDRWFFRFNQLTGHVALPYVFDRLMQVTTDGVPRMITSPWFEFVAYGPGIQDDYDARGNKRRNWTDSVIDRGDSPVQRQIPDLFELTGPWTLRVYTALDETGPFPFPPNINIQGLDENGLIIRTLSDGSGMTDGTAVAEYINGANYPMDHSQTYTTSAQQYSKITGVSKPETNGYIRVTAWNGTDEVELSNYAYNETTPSYRHYYIPTLRKRCDNCDNLPRILEARCRKRFVPAEQNEDILIIGNTLALQEMIIAQWKKLTDINEYAVRKLAAIGLMKEEAMAYRGKSRVPAIQFQRGFSLGAMPFVR